MKSNVNRFGVHLKVSNFEKVFSFYKALGFDEEFAYGPKEYLKQFGDKIPTAPEKYRGVIFNVGGSILELGESHSAIKPEVFKKKITSSKVSAMLQVDSIESVIQKSKEHNIKLAVPPRVFPWGTREVVIRDPDGFVLVFIEKSSM